MKPNQRGVKRIFLATLNSLKGIASAWRYEAAFRQELALCAVLAAIAFWLDVSVLERLLLLLTLFILLITELLNSAVEAVVDRIGPERHELSGRAKDLASAAVFFALGLIIVVWAGILFFN